MREAINTEGIVELEGRAVRTDDQVESPFTETPCLAYGYEIEQYRKSKHGNNTGKWKTIYSGRDGVPFRLEDDTGGLLVDPATASVSFASGDSIEVDGGSTAGEPIASFLKTITVDTGEGSTGALGIKTGDWRRYNETRLEDGEEVHVYGPIERNPSISTQASDFDAAVRDGSGSERFLVSDTDESATIRRLLKSGMKAIAGALLLGLGVAGLLAPLLPIGI